MIFLTVGSELPFSRLVSVADAWLGDYRERAGEVPEAIAQIGKVGHAGFWPEHFSAVEALDPAEYEKLMDEATVIIAHAGMGSIIGALTRGKPIVILPRRECFHETRNDHQVATAEKFGDRANVFFARSEAELPGRIEAALEWASQHADTEKVSAFVDRAFAARLRDFITLQV